jgi:hypothetical protein
MIPTEEVVLYLATSDEPEDVKLRKIREMLDDVESVAYHDGYSEGYLDGHSDGGCSCE